MEPAPGVTVATPPVHGTTRGVLDTIGATPLVPLTGYLEVPDVALHLKLETANPGGSAKDRPALLMLEEARADGRLHAGSVVVESSSGNTGIGLAQVCRYYGLRCILVVDVRTQAANLAAMRALGADVEVVVPCGPDVDPLVARLERVAELVALLPEAFWPNQYANPANARAHELGTMAEIDAALDGQVDVLFVAVSSTGTLGGCLDRIAARGLRTEVVAVDAIGSVLFGGVPGPRLIPGLGAGREPALASGRRADRVIRVSDLDAVVGCRRVARTDALLVGGSAGGVLHAVRQRQHELAGATVVAVAADSGYRYLDTVFDDAWVQRTLGCSPTRLSALVGDGTVSRW
ncbi:MAG: pyridoxal-phosphate dependent enzyme [Nitriliruptoraceae bacterium]|nr:pyridoxal-phosphate dependent enzyme [Nitriliruptoraceae bacterium]